MSQVWINNELPVSAGTLEAYREANLRLPLFSLPAQRAEKLAIVGSGPSLRKHFQEIADFDGDVWAINGAWRWLADHGVEAIFFSIDPLPIVSRFAKGAKRCILASQCDPEVFAELQGSGTEMFRLEREVLGGFSATGAAITALEAGYEKIFVYGCECSTTEHVDGRSTDEIQLVIGVGEEEFLTRPAYYQQAIELSRFIGNYPRRFKERSGGLLAALVGCFDLNGSPPEMPWGRNPGNIPG